MNKLIIVFTAVAILGSACAQTDSTNKKTSSSDNYSMNQDRDLNNQNRDQNINQNRDLNNSQNQNALNNSNDRTPTDGVIMKNGRIMMVRNGQLTVLDRDMTLSNGTKIKGDGTYTDKNGTVLRMKEGQQLDLSGKLIQVDANKDKNIYLVPDSTRR